MNGIDIVLIILAILVLFLILKTLKKLVFAVIFLVFVFILVGVGFYYISQSDGTIAVTITTWVMGSRFGAPLFNTVSFLANILN